MNQLTVLSPDEAYRLWAPTYSSETVISLIDDEVVSKLTPPLDGLRLLDAACGTGRRLAGTQARSAVGIDSSAEMLAVANLATSSDPAIKLIRGDLRRLPVEDKSFDIVWCRLAIGHLADCRAAYAELGRVARPGATVVVTDFHPAAWAAGHRRTFRDQSEVYEIEHHVHDLPTQLAAASAVGLESTAVEEGTVGPTVRHLYVGSDAEERYSQHCQLPIVLALSFRRRN